jgi:hypothetical protein
MRARATALVLILGLTAAPASADTITFSFAGYADAVGAELAGTFQVNDPLTGLFDFDPLAATQGCLPAFIPIRCYYSPLQLLSGTLGFYAFSANFVVLVQNDFGSMDGWSATAGPRRGSAQPA